jgi:iron complex outermembrane receptor protein
MFAEGEFALAHNLVLDGGARLDYFQAYGAALSPRAALIYSPDSRTTLKYIFGRAFRAPNAYESYYSDGMSQEPPLTKLRKENIQSNEVVFDRSLNSWLGITLDGYYNTLDHLIDFVRDSSNGLNRAVNIGQNRGRGVELEIKARHTSGWEGRASYALADAVDQLNNRRLDNSPLHQGKLNATIPLARRGFAGLELQYISAQSSYQGTRVPPAFLTNLTLSTRPFWGGWELSASGYNMLDRRWFTPAGLNSTEPAIQQDGRTFRFQISYRFVPEQKRSLP